jgi:hypothetical protein
MGEDVTDDAVHCRQCRRRQRTRPERAARRWAARQSELAGHHSVIIAGSMAVIAGSMAGIIAGSMAGITAGSMAGITAGRMAGITAGRMAGITAAAWQHATRGLCLVPHLELLLLLLHPPVVQVCTQLY